MSDLRTEWKNCSLLSVALVAGVVQIAQAQNAALACGNGRYIDDLFSEVAITPDIVFGYNTSRNYASGVLTPVTLKLDLYEPAGDVAVQRPLIILAFGGAFVQGSRHDTDIVSICQSFARKGYVTAAIDYRLIEPDFANQLVVASNPSYLTDEVIRAASDMKAAVRFFKYDADMANAYHIDPTKIFVGGFSAGAITALQVGYTERVTENPTTTTAYANNGGLEGNTDLLPPLLPAYSASGIAGVFNIAGGVNNLAIVNAGNPPLYSAQGTVDMVVPYDCGTIQFTTFTLCGSHQLEAQATAVGLLNQLHPVVGGNHNSPANEPDRSQIITEAAAFLQALVCATAPLPVVLTAFTGHVASTDQVATLAWQTASEHNSLGFEVQASPDGQTFSTLGNVPSKNRLTGASYTYCAGLLRTTSYFRLKMIDQDEAVTYSPVVTLLVTRQVGYLQLTPNPFENQLVISGLPTGRNRLLLYDATGRLVHQTIAAETIICTIGALRPGFYFLKVLDEAGALLGSAKVVRR